MAEGFLGRWSQRKQAQRIGKTVPEPLPAVVKPAPVEGLLPGQNADTPRAPQPPRCMAAWSPSQAAQAAPLSLDDVKSLTAESDFAPFAARGVAPEVRNAAMKKLFTDPHYNLMDRLDIYIDDYSQADPLPESMLRQMASAKFLKLFSDQEIDQAKVPDSPARLQGAQNPANDVVPASALTQNTPATRGVTRSDVLSGSASTDPVAIQEAHHDDTDMLLQPNDAAGRRQPGRVPQRNPDAA